MPILPAGGFMLESEIRNTVRTTRLIFGNAAASAEAKLRRENLPGMRELYASQLQHAKAELAYADELEKVLQ